MCNLLRDRRGIASMEYAILAAVVLVAVSVGAASVSTDITALFAKLTATVTGITG